MRSIAALPVAAFLVSFVTACGGSSDGHDPAGGACYDAADLSGAALTFGAPLEVTSCTGDTGGATMTGVGQAALPASRFANGAACGACFEVAGPAGTRTVRVVDVCTGCGANDLFDLDAETFTAIAGGTEVGRVDVTARAVACPVTGGIRFASGTATNPYFVQLWVTNHRHPLETIEVRLDGAYEAMQRTATGAFQWTSAGVTAESPYVLRVTDVFGHAVEDTIAVDPGAAASGTAQLPVCD